MIVSTPASAKASYVIKSPQPWVRPMDLESATTISPSSASSTFLLDDHQIRVSQRTVDRYYHHIQKIESAAGLTDLSQFKLYFEPSYQQLAIHFLRIWRDGALIDALRPSEIKVIQQEEGLNRQIYNGTLAALIFLNDLRVGDIVDYAYTVSGENPVLGGHFADALYLADSQPIQHLKFRLVWPATRALKIKNANIEIDPTVSTSGNQSEYVWERRDVAAISVEDATPDWFDPYPTVTISEFQTWSDVVQWALPLYGSDNSMPPDLLSKIHKWQTDFVTSEERTVAALRFVQDEIRYLGIELGRYSHQPSLPAKVFARRFGDCKDKSLLLSTILQSMGIDAAPALVDSTEGRSLDQQQPSPFAFDHVIVKAQISGKTFWLDPTISYQRGGLDKYYHPTYERALVLREGVADLEKIPLPTDDSGQIVIRERYEGKTSGPISLVVSTTYFGAEADRIRYDLSRDTLAELSKSFLNFYGEANPSIKAESLPQLEDDPVTNTVMIKERYLINEFWRDRKHNFIADKIYAEVYKPNVTQRTMPLRIKYPISISHTIDFDLSERFAINPDRGTIYNDFVRFDYSFTTQGSNIKLEYSLKTLADTIPVNKIPQHLLVLDRIQSFVGFELSNARGVTGYPGRGSNRTVDVVVGVVMIVGLLTLVAVSLIRGRMKSKVNPAFGQGLKATIGFAPETAIRVRHEADIEPALRAFKCSCGQNPYQPESPPQSERFTYDEQRLIGFRLFCSSCRRTNDLYFHAWSSQPGHTPAPQAN